MMIERVIKKSSKMQITEAKLITYDEFFQEIDFYDIYLPKRPHI